MLRLFYVFLFLPSAVFSGGSHSKQGQPPADIAFSYTARPKSINTYIDRRFGALQVLPASDSFTPYLYEIAGVDVAAFAESLIKNSMHKQHFTFLELNDIHTNWGEKLAKSLGKISGVTVNIISIAEGTSGLSHKEEIGCCTYYKLYNFKIDDLIADLKLCEGLDLKHGCDLIISENALSTAFDPAGLFCHLYEMLNTQGFIFAKGFNLYNKATHKKLQTENFYEEMNFNLKAFLTALKHPFALHIPNEGGEIGDVCFQRRHLAKLELKNIYTSSCYKHGRGELACVYDLSLISDDMKETEAGKEGPAYFGTQSLITYLSSFITAPNA